MDVNNFGPFHADVWGTTSDWIIAIATIGSIILLIKTLRSQTAVQNLQVRITRIENEKFRIENLPNFEIRIVYVAFGDTTKEKFEVSATFNIVLLKHSATNALITTKASHGEITSKVSFRSKITITEQSVQPFKVVTMVNRSKYIEDGLSIVMTLRFSDLVGNEYSQNFTFSNIFTDNEILQDAYPTLLNPL